MKPIFIVAFVVLMTCEYISCDDIDEGELHNGLQKQYIVKTDFLTNWYRANHYCASNGMRLASILTEEENQELIRVIRESGYRDPLWLGGTNLGERQHYYWMGNNKALKYTNWVDNEPNNEGGNEHCIEVWLRLGFEWNDKVCSQSNAFVCEK